MNHLKETVFSKPIEAILPTYDTLGNNTCKILPLKGASKQVPINAIRFIHSWFQTLQMDLYSQRMWSQEILDQKNLNPLIINEHMILIPVKYRKAIGAKDGCYGYIRLKSIKKIKEHEILLSSGVTIPHLSSTQTIYRKIREAKLLKYKYLEKAKLYYQIFNPPKEELYKDDQDQQA